MAADLLRSLAARRGQAAPELRLSVGLPVPRGDRVAQDVGRQGVQRSSFPRQEAGCIGQAEAKAVPGRREPGAFLAWEACQAMAPGGEDADWMRVALDEAALGRGAVEPNPMVGAVLVRDGRPIAIGHHERFGGPHAEVVALGRAGESVARRDPLRDARAVLSSRQDAPVHRGHPQGRGSPGGRRRGRSLSPGRWRRSDGTATRPASASTSAAWPERPASSTPPTGNASRPAGPTSPPSGR